MRIKKEFRKKMMSERKKEYVQKTLKQGLNEGMNDLTEERMKSFSGYVRRQSTEVGEEELK